MCVHLVGELVVLELLSAVGEVLHLRQELSLGCRRVVIGRTAGAGPGLPEERRTDGGDGLFMRVG